MILPELHRKPPVPQIQCQRGIATELLPLNYWHRYNLVVRLSPHGQSLGQMADGQDLEIFGQRSGFSCRVELHDSNRSVPESQSLGQMADGQELVQTHLLSQSQVLSLTSDPLCQGPLMPSLHGQSLGQDLAKTWKSLATEAMKSPE